MYFSRSGLTLSRGTWTKHTLICVRDREVIARLLQIYKHINNIYLFTLLYYCTLYLSEMCNITLAKRSLVILKYKFFHISWPMLSGNSVECITPNCLKHLFNFDQYSFMVLVHIPLTGSTNFLRWFTVLWVYGDTFPSALRLLLLFNGLPRLCC